MAEISGDWVIAAVFGVGVFYAFFQILTGLAKQLGWREFEINVSGLVIIGILLVATTGWVIGTKYLSEELTSSVRLAGVLWALLMLLPTAVYAGIANKFITPGRRKNEQAENTGEKKRETE